MKKILLYLTIASVALALFIVPCSAFTIVPDGYQPDGSYGYYSYTVTQGSYRGQTASIPISVGAPLDSVTTSNSSQTLTNNAVEPRGFRLANLSLEGTPGVANNGGSFDIHLHLAIQYTPAQLRTMMGYSAVAPTSMDDYILIMVASRSGFVRNFKVQTIRHYADGDKTSVRFVGDNGTSVFRLRDSNEDVEVARNIFSDELIAVSFVISADITQIDRSGFSVHLPNGYGYSTLLDDYNAVQEENYYNNAYDMGYEDATEHWEEANFNITTWLWDMVSGFLNFQLIPNMPLWTFFLAILGILLLRAILVLVGGG